MPSISKFHLITSNKKFIEDARSAIELVKFKHPDDGRELEDLVAKLQRKFNDFINSIETLIEKIKLDTAGGVRTNPLYIEMFSRITKGKFADISGVRICVLI